MNPQSKQPTVDERVLTLRILWMALLMSIAIYYVLTLFVARPEVAPNPSLSIGLIGVAMLAILISFLIKNRLLDKAVAQQNPGMAQQAYVVACAITEVAALLGLVDYFTTADRYHHALFLIGAVGML